MSRKIHWRGNTIVLNDEAPELKAGDRVSYTIHDWMEGAHSITGEVVSVSSASSRRDVARVKVGAGLQEDVVHEVPVLALTVVAPVVQLKGNR
jgi:hypothetical protein